MTTTTKTGRTSVASCFCIHTTGYPFTPHKHRSRKNAIPLNNNEYRITIHREKSHLIDPFGTYSSPNKRAIIQHSIIYQ